MEAPWRIYMLGGLRVERDDRTITRFRTQKAGVLLAYLAYDSHRSHLRDQLVELLWPECNPQAGRSNLSRELSGLRDQLEHSDVPGARAHRGCLTVIVADRTTVRLNPEAVSTDTAAFEAALQSAERAGSPADGTQHLAAAIEVYGGELLPGYYDGWILQEREWLADRYFQALGQLLAHLEQAGELSRALEYARCGVRADPLREEGQRDLIRLLAAAGQPGAALRQYRELERLLKQELEAEPSAVTRALARQIAALADQAQGAGDVQTSRHGPAPASTAAGDAAAGLLPAAATRSAGAPPMRLPVPRTPLLGREKEVAAARELLRRADVGLVTFTGPGGTGKTRLALHVAAGLQDDFSDGVFFVSLAPLRDHGLVPSTIAQVLGVRESVGRSILESLKGSLRERQILLLLDNFEPVLEAALLLAELLAAAPRLKLLVTSRIVLRLQAEHEFPVPPLAVPDLKRLPSLPNLSRYAAVELFVQRAQAARPAFTLTAENAGAVAEICHRLDGLPLAIELAAARIRLLPPQALLARLENRLPLLTGGARDLPARQQSLRNTIAWSCDLLDEPERTLFRRVSVFVGGFTLQAAEVVCSDDDRRPADDDRRHPTHSSRRSVVGGREVLEGVASLIDRSLLRALDGEADEPRFGMRETIREYGQECLEASGEEEAARRQHAQFFLALAERGEAEWFGPQQEAWIARWEREHANLRVALSWAAEKEEGERAEIGLRLAGSLWRFWQFRGYLSEGRRWLEEMLARSDRSGRTAARARALAGAGQLAEIQCEYGAARTHLEESIGIWRELEDKRGLALTLLWLTWVDENQGDAAAARRHLAESLALARESGDPWILVHLLIGAGKSGNPENDEASGSLVEEALTLSRELGYRYGIANSLSVLGNLAFNQGNWGLARTRHEEALALRREMGDFQGIAHSLLTLARVAVREGDWRRAAALWEERQDLCRQFGVESHDKAGLGLLGEIAQEQGEYERAAALFRQELEFWRASGSKLLVPGFLADLGKLAGRQVRGERSAGDAGLGHTVAEKRLAERAARLLGAAEALREANGQPQSPRECAEVERPVAAARAALGEEAFAAAWAEGRAMSLDQAVAYAMRETAPD